MITSENRFQITHGSVALFGNGAFVVFDVMGEADSIVTYDYAEAIVVRDNLRAGQRRGELKLIIGGAA